MFKHFTTRVFSLQHAVSQREFKQTAKDRFIPVYFSFYSEDDSKYITPLEQERKEWIAHHIKEKNNLTFDVC